MKRSGIYAIGTPSGRIYVGSSKNLTERKAQHWRELRKGTHRNRFLQFSYDKYGADGLTFSVLEFCAPEEMVAREQQFSAKLWPKRQSERSQRRRSASVSPVRTRLSVQRWPLRSAVVVTSLRR